MQSSPSFGELGGFALPSRRANVTVTRRTSIHSDDEGGDSVGPLSRDSLEGTRRYVSVIEVLSSQSGVLESGVESERGTHNTETRNAGLELGLWLWFETRAPSSSVSFSSSSNSSFSSRSVTSNTRRDLCLTMCTVRCRQRINKPRRTRRPATAHDFCRNITATHVPNPLGCELQPALADA
jgi:hypothetical protein